MARLTVREVLAMPVVRGAAPEVLAGAEALGAPVRWVHSTELADIAPLLRRGELVLSTGIALPGDPEGLAHFARSLVDAGAAGLVIELGRRWTERPPEALVQACEEGSLPLVTLGREVKFAAIAQVVGERIVDEQLAELRTAERIHDTFTDLSANEAGPKEILAATQRLAGTGVVLESEQHRVIDYVTGPAGDAFLEDWYDRSRRVVTADRTAWDAGNGWLVARVGRRDRGWGRLVLQAPAEPTHHLFVLAERAAAALALHRLHDRDRTNALRRTQHELLLALLGDPEDLETHRRCELAGFPMSRRRLVGLTLRPVVRGSAPGRSRAPVLEDVVAGVVLAAHRARLPVLVSDLDGDVRALVSLPPAADATALVDRLVATLPAGPEVVVGAGRPAEVGATPADSLRESLHVVDSVPAGTPRGRGPVTVHRLEDTHLRGLLALLGDDERLDLFVRRELAALNGEDAESRELRGVLRALLTSGGSKSEAAASLHLSRPALYARLSRLERTLNRDLTDPETRTSLHVALLARDLRRPVEP